MSIDAAAIRSHASNNRGSTMRYICLVHFEHGKLTDLPPAERQEIDRRSLAYNRELEARGHYILSEAIEGSDHAVLVRSRNGKVTSTDGPYIETKEQMAGFILVEARDLNEAVQLAAGIPLAEIGTIEVRPIYEIPTPPEKA
jgi:hypothetical protein